MGDTELETDLQEVVEEFLRHTEQHRSEVVHRRYSVAMELLMSFLAVKLLDPESREEGEPRGPAGTLRELTPDIMKDYVSRFLLYQLGGDRRLMKRHLSALRSFIGYLMDKDTLSQKRGQHLGDILRGAVASLRHIDSATSEDDEYDDVQLLRVTGGDGSRDEVDFQDLLTGEAFQQVRVINSDHPPIEEGDVCLMRLDASSGSWRGECLGVMDADMEPALLLPRSDELEEGLDEELDEEFLDGDLDLEDLGDEDDHEDLELTPEEAMEILVIEDRYAPQSVVAVALEHLDEVRDELLEWILDDSYRDMPVPGTGEAPANAARILSEGGEPKIIKRLLEVLGDHDPLAEEAPLALARLGPRVGPHLMTILGENDSSDHRRWAATWALGYLAARHPSTRPKVIEAITDEALNTKSSPATALNVLSEIRAVESLDLLKKSYDNGSLDLEQWDLTWELLQSRMEMPGWGDAMREAFIPLLHLYPTDMELDDLYSSIEEDFGILGEELVPEEWDDLAQIQEEIEEELRDSLEGDFAEIEGRPEDRPATNDDGESPFRPSRRKERKLDDDPEDEPQGAGGKVLQFPPNKKNDDS